MENINYFRAIHGAIGANSAEETLRREVRKDRAEDYTTSIGYIHDALRNGEVQPIVAKTTNSPNKYNIIAMPGDPLAVGDILEFYGEHWIVVDIRSVDVVSLIGVAMQCNHLFRWQNWTPDIVERWGVLDSGVYSTTLSEAEKMTLTHKQYKIYLPFDEDTSKLYLDKRIITEVAYDKDGERIPVVYKVTGRDSISESYGKGGHLLVLNAESSSDYNKLTDNLDLMIADYIAPEEEPAPPVTPDPPTPPDPPGPVDPPDPPTPPLPLLPCSISGRETLKAGLGARKYTVTFYEEDGETEDASVIAFWTVVLPAGYESYIHYMIHDNTLSLSADEDAIGEMVILQASDADGLYQPCEFTVKVVGSL